MRKLIVSLVSCVALYPLSMSDGVNKVVSKNPEMQAMQAQIDGLKAANVISMLNFLPTLDLNASYGVVNELVTNADARSGNQIDLGLKAKWNLFNGFYDLSTWDATSTQVASYEVQKKILANKLLLDYVTNYIDVVKSKELLELTKEKLKMHQELYGRELKKNAQNFSSLSYISKTKAKVEQTELEIIEAKNTLSNHIDALSRYVEVGEKENFYVPAVYKKLPNTLKDAQDELFAHSAELTKADIEVAISKAEGAKEFRKFFPKVDITGEKKYYQYYYAADTQYNKTQVGAELSWNLFNGWKDTTSFVQGMTKVDQKIEEGKKIKQDLIYKFQLIYNRIELANAKNSVLSEYMKSKYKGLEGTQYDFDYGKIDINILLDTVSDYYAGREMLIEHKYNTLLDKYKYYESTSQLDDILAKKDSMVDEPIVLEITPTKPTESEAKSNVTNRR